tara:strand:+ start:176 stop:349 length:174 start_codon:yes stop_codon:yes gene_type:complete
MLKQGVCFTNLGKDTLASPSLFCYHAGRVFSIFLEISIDLVSIKEQLIKSVLVENSD